VWTVLRNGNRVTLRVEHQTSDWQVAGSTPNQALLAQQP